MYKVNKQQLIFITIVTLLLFACAIGCGCSQQTPVDKKAVAGSVEDYVVYEYEITADVDAERELLHLEKDSDFAQWLVNIPSTPEEYRQNLIYSYLYQQFSLPLYAKELGCYIDDEDKIERIISKEAMQTMSDHGASTYSEFLAMDNLTDKIFRQDVISDMSARQLANYYKEHGQAMPEEYFIRDVNNRFDGAVNEKVYFIVYGLGLTEQEAVDTLSDEGNTSNSTDFIPESRLHKNIPSDPYIERNFEQVVCAQQMNLTEPGEVKTMKFNMESPYDDDTYAERYIAVKFIESFDIPENGYTSIDQVPDELLEDVIKRQPTARYENMMTSDVSHFFHTLDMYISPMPENLPYNVSLEGLRYAPEITNNDQGYEDNKFQL